MNNEPELQNAENPLPQTTVQEEPVQPPQIIFVQPAAFTQQVEQPTCRKKRSGKGIALSIVGMVLGIIGLFDYLYTLLYVFCYFFILPGFINFAPSELDAFQQAFFASGAEMVYVMAIIEYLVIAFVSSLIGLILSVRGKNLTGSKAAKTGVLLNTITFVGSIFTAAALIVLKVMGIF